MDRTGASAAYRAVWFAGRIPVDRVRGEYPRADQAKAGSAEEQRRHRRRGFNSRAPDAGGEQTRQRAAREEVDLLGPAGVTKRERAHRMPPRAVATAPLTFDQGHADEQRRHHDTTIDQQPRCACGAWLFHGRGAYSRQRSNE